MRRLASKVSYKSNLKWCNAHSDSGALIQYVHPRLRSLISLQYRGLSSISLCGMALTTVAVMLASFVKPPAIISVGARQQLRAPAIISVGARQQIRAPLRCCAAAPAFATPSGGESEESSVRVLFDSTCAVCLTNKAMLTFFDKKKRLRFVDVASISYLPEANGGISYEDAMAHFHTIDEDGAVVEGADAILLAYSRVGLGWLVGVLRTRLLRWLIDFLYSFVSKNRHRISRLPGARRFSKLVEGLHQVESAAQGIGCDDEEECELPPSMYDGVDDEA